jgi:hypothetical protein
MSFKPFDIIPKLHYTPEAEEALDGPFSVRSRKLSNIGWSSDGWPKIYYLELRRASQDTLSRWSRLQSLAPTDPHWARVVCYGPFSLWVIHKEGLCPSSGDIHRLMMMMNDPTAAHSLWVGNT